MSALVHTQYNELEEADHMCRCLQYKMVGGYSLPENWRFSPIAIAEGPLAPTVSLDQLRLMYKGWELAHQQLKEGT